MKFGLNSYTKFTPFFSRRQRIHLSTVFYLLGSMMQACDKIAPIAGLKYNHNTHKIDYNTKMHGTTPIEYSGCCDYLNNCVNQLSEYVTHGLQVQADNENDRYMRRLASNMLWNMYRWHMGMSFNPNIAVGTKERIIDLYTRRVALILEGLPMQTTRDFDGAKKGFLFRPRYVFIDMPAMSDSKDKSRVVIPVGEPFGTVLIFRNRAITTYAPLNIETPHIPLIFADLSIVYKTNRRVSAVIADSIDKVLKISLEMGAEK